VDRLVRFAACDWFLHVNGAVQIVAWKHPKSDLAIQLDNSIDREYVVKPNEPRPKPKFDQLESEGPGP
jgi:hypothetical protein